MSIPPGHWITASRPIGSGNGATGTGARVLGGVDGRVHVLDEIAGPLGAERIGNGRYEGEDESEPAGVCTAAKVALLGVGVTVVVAGLEDCPPNVAVKLAMNGAISAGAT